METMETETRVRYRIEDFDQDRLCWSPCVSVFSTFDGILDPVGGFELYEHARMYRDMHEEYIPDVAVRMVKTTVITTVETTSEVME